MSNYYEERLREKAGALEVERNALRKELIDAYKDLRKVLKQADDLVVERDALREELASTNKVLFTLGCEVCAYQKSYDFLKEARRDIEKAFPEGDFDADIEACMQAVEGLK